MAAPQPTTDESLARLQRIINRLPLMVASYDRARRFTFANQLYAERIGVTTPDQLIGRRIDDVLGPAVAARMAPHIERVLAGEDAEFEITVPFAGIGIQHVRGIYLPERDEEGAVIGWNAVLRVVTRERRVETDVRNLATLVENANDFIGWCDLDLRPVYVNRFGLTVLGTTLEEVRGCSIMDFFFPEDIPMIRDEFIPLVRRDGFAAVEVRFRHFRTGAPVWMHYSVVPMRGADDEVIGFATISRDLTERRRKEDALVAADRQKDEFLGMLAHELRNPLAPMTYSIAALERTAGPEAARPLALMSRQVRRMTRIVDDLLDISRVTQGKISLQRTEVDLVAVVTHVVDALRPTMEARNHRVALSLPTHPVRVSGDAVRLAQVLENLLGNAAKYTQQDGSIEVALDRRGGHARIVVRDNGIGISAKMLPQVFDLFFQADTALDRAEGGLGIGLTLVERLTRMHGGSVSAHSDGPGLGSEFVVLLPLLDAAAGDVVEAEGVDQQTSSRRYLVVDDNEDAAEALGLLLEMSGHVVRIVHSGQLAATAAREFHPDVVLLDVGLPGMDGYEVVRQFRASSDLAQLMIIATTGYGRAEDRARCLAAGFDHHLVKPLDVDQIERLVGGSSTAS